MSFRLLARFPARFPGRLPAWAGAALLAGTALASPALAQSQANANAAALLSPFVGLTAYPDVLTRNLAQAVAINNGATAAQRAQAIHDNTINTDNGNLLADGLGTSLYTIYMNAIAANAPLLAADANLTQAFRQGNGITQADSGFNKYYMANGTTNGTTPVNTAIVPANPNPNVYGQAYGPGTPAGVHGNPRPFQVSAGIDDFAPSITSTLTTNPAFPSGHTTYAYTQSLLFAMMVPERYQEMMTRASEYGNSRIVLGAHYPLDVIGGRILATYDVAQLLNNNPDYLNQTISVYGVGTVTTTNDYATLFRNAMADMRGLLAAGCGSTDLASCAAAGAPDRFSNPAANLAAYEQRLTYGLPSTGPTNIAPVVPAGAEVLLETRLPFLTAAQRRDVLASTEIASGGPLDNGSGWARLDLYRAAGGYGAFDGNVTVQQDATLGGFNAFATFSNDITGAGGLTKTGSGTLMMTGNDTYAGGTVVTGGTLLAASQHSLGNGDVHVAGGTLASAVQAALAVAGDFTMTADSALEFDMTGGGGHQSLVIDDASLLDGLLRIEFADPLTMLAMFTISDAGGLSGDFRSIEILDAGVAFSKRIIRTADSFELDIAPVPEPGTLLLVAVGLGLVVVVRRRGRSVLPI
jgi:autotransporter-associated beta strand protein